MLIRNISGDRLAVHTVELEKNVSISFCEKKIFFWRNDKRHYAMRLYFFCEFGFGRITSPFLSAPIVYSGIG